MARLPPHQPLPPEEPPLDKWLRRGAPASARLPQQVPASRRRLLTALAALAQGELGDFPTAQTPFAAVEVDADRCSACSLCARFCPTGALDFDDRGDSFSLGFQAAACVDCGICVVACPEDAVSLGGSISLSAILADDALTRVTGTLAPCAICGAPTAPSSAGPAPRCHVCRYGAGAVTSLHDGAGLMADLFRRTTSLDG